MSRFALIDNATNIVVNIIIYNESQEYHDKTVYLVKTDIGNIGNIYDKLNQTFIIPEVEVDIEIIRSNLLNNLSDNLKFHEEKGTEYNNNIFPTDNNSQVKYLAILLTATMDPTFTTVFKTTNGEYVNLNAQEILLLCNKIREYIKKCYEHDDYLTNLIKNANNKEDLNSIDVQLGWPS